MKLLSAFLILITILVDRVHAEIPRQFLEAHCVECHDADSKKGGLDLTALSATLEGETLRRG